MALTISPAGSGSRRNWRQGSLGFTAGLLLGATATYFPALALARLLALLLGTAGVRVAILVVWAFGAAADFGHAGLGLYRNAQVPESWRRAMSPTWAATAYGTMLGLGFATFFTTSLHLSVLVGASVSGSLLVGLGAVALYALGKAVVVLVGAGTGTLEEVSQRVTNASGNSRPAVWVRRGTSLACSGILLASALRIV